jgi:riboflavin transporter FmnP
MRRIAPCLFVSSKGSLIALAASDLLDLTGPASVALLVGAAIILNYWWAVPLIAETLEIPATGVWMARGVVFALVACWLVHAWPRLQGRLRKV